MSDFGHFDPANVYENLPEDPEQAFLLLEEQFRLECEKRVNDAHREENLNIFYVDYIAQVIGAITELELEANFKSPVPQIEQVATAVT